MSKQVLTVSSLVRYLKNRLEGDSMTQHVLVEGELSNFSNYRSGHWYFTLKDSNAQLRCAMFASSNRKISYVPKDGDKVLVQGDISVFEGRGEMQLIVTNMKPSGIGDLFIQFEALKKKLSEEGLFAEEHKKEIPLYPEHIGLVTGKNTAARSDVLTTLQRRWPVAEVHEYPVLVQGTGSAEQITDALKYMDTLGYDVILLVRGGGSIEDLWSFNSEMLARTIYDLNTPIITGVGHEVDFTIADFVADLRAPTPTGAAERCSPDIREVKDFVQTMKDRLNRETTALLNTSSQRLDINRNSAI
ncbi:MAG: exodeoxyribonuclease VII large subunit, partial [Solobacterium sp.]|nr:exodeoxyribonuclease VII large subunit [Solobacterium sp.]